MNIFSNFWFFLDNKEKKFFFLIVILSIFQALLEMIGIATVIPFITFLLKPESFDNLNFLPEYINFDLISQSKFILIFCIILFSIFLIKNIIILITNNFTYKFIYLLRTKIYNKLLQKMLAQNYLFFVKKGMSKIFNATYSESTNFAANIVRPIIHLITEFLVCFGIIVLVIITGFVDGLLLILPIIVLVGLFLKKINKSIKAWSNQRIVNNENIFNLNYNLINGIKEILIYDKVKKILLNFGSVLKSAEQVDTKNSVIVTLPRILLEQAIILVFISIILTMSYFGNSYDNILVILTFYLAIAYRLVPSINKIFVAYQQIKFGKPSLPYIMEYYNLKNKISKSHINKNQIVNENKQKTLSSNIELKDIAFAYPNSDTVLKNINIKINKNEIVGIFGESGSGKSTLINILIGLIKPTQGSLYLDGNNIVSDEDMRQYQNLFSISSQDSFLINGSIKDNIIFGSNSEISNDKLNEAISDACLVNTIQDMKYGLETDVGLTLKKLSSGQKQRISLARCFYLNKDIMIFDEATNALDEQNEKNIFEYIKNLKNKKTIIIVSHNLNNLKICDSIYNISNKSLEKK